jgi:lipid-A-disaccharide synthase
MLVLFRFEEELYRRHGVAVTWVGHPLKDHATPTVAAEDAAAQIGLNPWRRTVGLLPGSREREVARHLPVLLAAARRIAWQMPGVEFIVPRAPGIPLDRLTRLLQQSPCTIHVAEGPLPNALQLMHAAIVSSGTATLEAALCAVPMAVVYRASWLTYLGARLVIRIPHIAMVNVVAGRPVVPEFVQHRARPQRLAHAIVELLRNEERAEQMRRDLREVSEQLGPSGAIDRAAASVLDMLNQSKGR